MDAERDNQDQSTVRWVAQNPAFFATAVIIVVATIRLFAVARGDVSTALALIHSSGPASVVLGSIVDLVPLFLISLGSLSLGLFLIDIRHDGRLAPAFLGGTVF